MLKMKLIKAKKISQKTEISRNQNNQMRKKHRLRKKYNKKQSLNLKKTKSIEGKKKRNPNIKKGFKEAVYIKNLKYFWIGNTRIGTLSCFTN